MKKFKISLFIFFIFALLGLRVDAASVSTSMSGVSSIDAKGSFSIAINISGDNVWGATMSLSYDKDKLELTSSTGQNGFTATVGSNIVLDSTSGHSGNFKAVVLQFKAKDSFTAGQSTTISISNVKVSSDTAVTTGSGTSKTIKVNVPKSSNNNLSDIKINGSLIVDFHSSVTSYNLGNTQSASITITATASDSKAKVSGTGTKKLNYGKNKFNIVVTAENGTKKTYSITITRPDERNTDNTLSSLSASPLNLKFNKNTTTYSFTVNHDVTSINIVAKASDSKAKVSGTGKKTLKDYSNKFNIVVTAENETKKTYTIIVNRKDADGTLGNLSKDNSLSSIIVEGFELDFTKDKINYTLEVDNSVNNVVVKATANDSKSSVTINNVDKLKVGNNEITIDVVAENGNKKTYTINVVRKDNIPTTTLDKLVKTLDNTENNKLIVEIRDNDSILTKEMIAAINKSNKEVTINKYDNDNNIIYTWIFNGKELEEEIEVNTNIIFNSENFDKISELTNYADAVYLNFEHEGNLPKGNIIRIYVADRYKDGDLVNIYYFNEKDNKMETIQKEIEVKEGYVEFTLEHCSEYIITRSTIQTEKFNIFILTTIIEFILLIGAIIYIFILSKKKKRHHKKVTT